MCKSNKMRLIKTKLIAIAVEYDGLMIDVYRFFWYNCMGLLSYEL